jgi:hypothetical protein
MMNVIELIRNQCSKFPRIAVTAIQPPNAIAAWPEGRPPRRGVPRPV